MATELLLSAETFAWGLQGICQLHRIPFAPGLILQQFPPPYSLLSLQQAAHAVGLKCGLRNVPLEELSTFPRPYVALLKPAALAGHNAAVDSPKLHQPNRLAIVVECSNQSIAYYEHGRRKLATMSLEGFGSEYEGKVMLCLPSEAELRGPDTESGIHRNFGFRWFVPQLLRHRKVWRDILLASLAIQMMALATPVFTQVVIDKVIVHQAMSTLAVVAVALGVFIIFSAIMKWLRQYLVLHTGNRIDAVLGSEVFEHLLKLPPRYFERRSTGVLVARIQGVETVVAPGTILLTLVPHDEPLIAEVWVGNADAGFVRSKQKARIKIAAYPFQKYGLIDGVVRQVGADAQSRSEMGNPAIRTVQDAAYRALITLGGSHLESQGKQLRLVPGMQVNAEIHLGTRTVLEYLLSPIQKIAHEAGRER